MKETPKKLASNQRKKSFFRCQTCKLRTFLYRKKRVMHLYREFYILISSKMRGEKLKI